MRSRQMGRAELLSTPFADYECQLREQMTEMLGASGFDARRERSAAERSV